MVSRKLLNIPMLGLKLVATMLVYKHIVHSRGGGGGGGGVVGGGGGGKVGGRRGGGGGESSYLWREDLVYSEQPCVKTQ